MNRFEFETLRDLPGKAIRQDIAFLPSREISTTLVFEQVHVDNSLGYDLVLNGSFVPTIPAIKFNFVVRGTGAICRVEVNGRIHGKAGRTHKHYLQDESCPRRNLPQADPRPDLDLNTLTPKQIWEMVCEQANITHEGEFVEPK